MMRVLIMLLPIGYVCTCHSPIYNYITATI